MNRYAADGLTFYLKRPPFCQIISAHSGCLTVLVESFNETFPNQPIHYGVVEDCFQAHVPFALKLQNRRNRFRHHPRYSLQVSNGVLIMIL